MNSSNDPIPPTPAKISGGSFLCGSLFRLIREIKGSKYKLGDQFILVEEGDCVDPNILKLGGVGETYFLDPTGLGLIIHADDTTIDCIFENIPVPDITEMILETTDSSIVPGSKGEKGEKGDRGESSSMRGDRGFPGSKGDKGEQGEVGSQGERGEQGESIEGQRGRRGEKGEEGERGIQGERGERGEQGEKGEDSHVSVEFPLTIKDNKIKIDEKK